jgi:hypothetical protein
MAIELGFMEHLTACEEIANRANKEYLIETYIKNLQEKWSDMKLKFDS